jgi:hypothetical protein
MGQSHDWLNTIAQAVALSNHANKQKAENTWYNEIDKRHKDKSTSDILEIIIDGNADDVKENRETTDMEAEPLIAKLTKIGSAISEACQTEDANQDSMNIWCTIVSGICDSEEPVSAIRYKKNWIKPINPCVRKNCGHTQDNPADYLTCIQKYC